MFTKAEKLAFLIYMDKYLEAGSPPLRHFFSEVLNSDERYWCFYVINEVNRVDKNVEEEEVLKPRKTAEEGAEILKRHTRPID